MKITEVLAKWARLSDNLEKAKALQNEKANRDLLDKYETAKKIKDEIAALDIGYTDLPCPIDAEIMQVKTAQPCIGTLETSSAV